MANLEVNTTVTAPSNIDIQLVRADIMYMSSTFRVFFEIFLSLTSALLGTILSIPEPSAFHWITLVVCVFFTATFLALSIRKQKESRSAG